MMCPNIPMAGGNVASHRKMINGIESRRLGSNNMRLVEINKKCFAINLGKYTGTQLDGRGDPTRAGASIMAVFANAGPPTISREDLDAYTVKR